MKSQFKFGELRKSGLTELKVKNASCLKGKKMGIRKCFLQAGDQMNDQFLQGVLFDWNRIDNDSYLTKYNKNSPSSIGGR